MPKKPECSMQDDSANNGPPDAGEKPVPFVGQPPSTPKLPVLDYATPQKRRNPDPWGGLAMILVAIFAYLCIPILAGETSEQFTWPVVTSLCLLAAGTVVLGLIPTHRGFLRRPSQRLTPFCLIIATSVLLPLFRMALVGPVSRIRCASNLRAIGRALNTYASHDPGGGFPSYLVELWLAKDLDSTEILCPSVFFAQPTPLMTPDATQNGPFKLGQYPFQYVYLGAGLSPATVTPFHVLAYENPSNHANKGMNVLFGDGHAEWLDQPEAGRVLAELQAGHNPPHPPPTRPANPKQ
jgi:prepilin-type processing-associated H-X9-DG protein